MTTNNEWDKWSQHILITIEQLHVVTEELKKADNENCNKVLQTIHDLEIRLLDKCNVIEQRVTAIETRAVMLGAGAGLIISIIGVVLKYVT